MSYQRDLYLGQDFSITSRTAHIVKPVPRFQLLNIRKQQIEQCSCLTEVTDITISVDHSLKGFSCHVLILLHSVKTRSGGVMINKQMTLNQCEKESDEWKRTLTFLSQENSFLKLRLADVLKAPEISAA